MTIVFEKVEYKIEILTSKGDSAGLDGLTVEVYVFFGNISENCFVMRHRTNIWTPIFYHDTVLSP